VCDLETSRMGAPYIYMTLVAQGLIHSITVAIVFIFIQSHFIVLWYCYIAEPVLV